MTKTDLVEEQCGVCGVWHAIPKIMRDTYLEEGGFWHCPNGHKSGWREGRKKQDELRRERDLLKQQMAQKDDEIKSFKVRLQEADRRVSAYKGEATKIRNRAKNGLCPCCNRSFTNLSRHMATKHPDFDAKVIPIDIPPKNNAA